ncbi:hypothetical protein [Bradyrhizobium sp. HKCCYLRH3061]|uniref:hypothetical protein n=1 Tax=Bradyrhizobium sp. HKCCYLRH3061 TaxID=3420734 RepID=UPI003EBDD1D4
MLALLSKHQGSVRQIICRRQYLSWISAVGLREGRNAHYCLPLRIANRDALIHFSFALGVCGEAEACRKLLLSFVRYLLLR